MMPSRSCSGVRPEADKYCGRSCGMFFTTPFSNGEGVPYSWLPMGSPGAFIHSGISGGRLPASAAAALAGPARPPTRDAPPMTAPLRRNWRRDVPTAVSPLLDLVISRLVLSSRRHGRPFASCNERGPIDENAQCGEIASGCRGKSAWQHRFAYLATSAPGQAEVAGIRRQVAGLEPEPAGADDT